MDAELKAKAKAKAPITVATPVRKSGIDLVLSRLELLSAEVTQLSDKLDDALSVLAELQIAVGCGSPSGIEGDPWPEDFEYKDHDML